MEKQMTESTQQKSNNNEESKGKKRKEIQDTNEKQENNSTDNKKRRKEDEILIENKEMDTKQEEETTEVFHDAQKRTVFIKNIAFSVTEEDLQKSFEKFGKIKQLRLVTDQITGKSKGFAYVEYLEEPDAIKAQTMMNREKIHGRQLMVEMSSSSLGENKAHLHTIYLSNIPYDSVEEDISEAFKASGLEKLKEIRIIKNKSGQSTCAFVEFYSVEDTKKAYTLSGQIKVKERECFVERAKSVKEKKVTDGIKDKATSIRQINSDDSKTVFVGEIPIDVTEEQLTDLFNNSCGKVERIRLAKARKGVSKGKAFVDFFDISSKEKAVGLNGSLEIGGQVLLVQNPAPPKKKTEASKFTSKRDNKKPFNDKRNNQRKERVKVSENNEQRDFTPKSNQDFKKFLLN